MMFSQTTLGRAGRSLLAFTAVAFFSGAALAGAWIDVNTLTVTRTYAGQGVYDVDVKFKVRRAPQDVGPPFKLNVCLRMSEDDGCWDSQFFKGQVTLCVPAPGNLSEFHCYTYAYPCSWGNDVRIEIANQQGFTGVSRTFGGLPLGAVDECGPAIPAGFFDFTPEVLNDQNLVTFFEDGQPQLPQVVASTYINADDGAEYVSFDTDLLPDPAPLDYEFYQFQLFDGPQLLLDLPLLTAGNILDPLSIPDPLMGFGQPGTMTLPLTLPDLQAQPVALILMIDADNILPPLPIMDAPLFPPPLEVLCRIGNTNTAVGVPFDSMLVNGSTGNFDRTVIMAPTDTLSIDFLEFPGVGGSYPYCVFANFGENGPLDLTPLPLDLGVSCFSLPFTGGNPITLLNTLGHEALLGVPRIPLTPLAPGPVFSFTRPAGLPALELSLQALVPDANSPNGQAALSNAVVLKIEE